MDHTAKQIHHSTNRKSTLNAKTAYCLLPLLALAGLAGAQTSKFSAELQDISAIGHVNVIVQYNHVPTAADHVRTPGPTGYFAAICQR